MKNQFYELYPFLQATAGSWRNAAYIECQSCPYGRNPLCSGFLITAGAEGTPIILSAERFYQQTGEYPDKTECVAILSRTAFESIYAHWLKWQINDPTVCMAFQLTT